MKKARKKRTVEIGSLLLIILCMLAGIIVWKAMTNKHVTVSFSKESGFYEKGFSLKLSSNVLGSKIYYTTDGSTPDKHSTLYQSPIKLKDESSSDNVLSTRTDTAFFADYNPDSPVPKGTVIRAVAYEKNGTKSEITTNSYFIGKDFADTYKNIPVVSIAVNPEDLTDYDTGIYVKGKAYDDWVADGNDPTGENVWDFQANFTQEGRDWERPATINYFENSSEYGFTQDLGMRIVGGFSRTVPQKSLKFFARSDYGDKRVRYQLFPGNTTESDSSKTLDTYKTFVLRNGGNDTWTTKFMNYYVESLVTDRAYDTHAARPVIAFLNGEYWGIYTMQEDYSDNYIESNYGVDKDNVVMVKIGTLEEGNPEDLNLYEDLITFAKDNDLSKEENYEKISSMLDIQSTIDYFCTELWISNYDWLNNDNNYRMWRARTEDATNPYGDTKWRYMLYDVEWCMGVFFTPDDANLDTLTKALDYPEDIGTSQVTLLDNLLKNETFKEQFVTTFMDLCNDNFTESKTLSKLDEISSEYRPFMADYYDRFGCDDPDKSTEECMDTFDTTVENVGAFLKKRNDYIPKMLKSDLDLSGDAIDVTIQVSEPAGGTITVNTITPDISSGSFTGTYFSDIPVTITATPKDGYEFTGWSGDVTDTNKSITNSFKKSVTLKAEFKKK